MKRLSIYFAIVANLTLKSYGHEVGSSERTRENENTTLKLYYNPLSPPSRAVLILLQILDLPHELQMINIFKGENLSDNFLRMNPQHTIPVLTDGLHTVVDSHAINMYLMNQYGIGDHESWYPTEAKARSLVDQRLYFDTGSLSQIIIYVVREHVILKTLTGLNKEIVLKIEDAYTTVEKFLTGSKFIAGNELTIADISVMISLSTLEVIWPPKPESYPALKSYMKMCTEQIPHFATINSPEVIEMWKKNILRSFIFKL